MKIPDYLKEDINSGALESILKPYTNLDHQNKEVNYLRFVEDIQRFDYESA